jgi:hypothetical protein
MRVDVEINRSNKVIQRTALTELRLKTDGCGALGRYHGG